MPRPLYAFSDIHGNLELFNKIDKIIKENNGYAYFLGDACDKGPNGYEIMNKLFHDPYHYCYIKGNHEDMFVHAAREIRQIANEDWILRSNPKDYYWDSIEVRLSIDNEGEATLLSWMHDGCNMAFINNIDKLPTWNIIYAPYMKRQVTMIHGSPTNKEWDRRTIDINPLLWGRCISEKWDQPGVLIHGHTPCQRMPQSFDQDKLYPLFYSNDTRINLDARTPKSHEIVLMNLIDQSYEIIKE